MLNVVGRLELGVGSRGDRCECGQTIRSGICLVHKRSGTDVKLCYTCANKKIDEALNYLQSEIQEYRALRAKL